MESVKERAVNKFLNEACELELQGKRDEAEAKFAKALEWDAKVQADKATAQK